jgi:hypothetical protein
MYQSKQNWKTNDSENQAKQPHSMQLQIPDLFENTSNRTIFCICREHLHGFVDLQLYIYNTY